MDIASFLGIIIGVSLIILGITRLTSNFIVFISLTNLLIVAGGSLAATLLSFSVKEVLGLIRSIFAVFRVERINMAKEVDVIVELAHIARRSTQELERSLDGINELFLRDGLQLVVDGYSKEEIRDILETRIENRTARERSEANVLRTMGKFSPAFGMVGTLIGLVVMLHGMSEIAIEGEDPMKVLGAGMGAALITTFYGLILANLIFNPMAVKFETRIEKKNVMQSMLIEGVILIHDRKHPLIIREKLNSFLRPSEWRRPEEK